MSPRINLGATFVVKPNDSANGVVTAYTYDKLNRLTSVRENGTLKASYGYGYGYGYDNNGNQISKISFSLGGASGSSTGASAAFGLFVFNPTGATSGGSDVTIELYEYNAFNQLIAVQNDEGIHSYAYKPDGLRLSKTTNGATTTHIWDGANIVMELNEISTCVAS